MIEEQNNKQLSKKDWNDVIIWILIGLVIFSIIYTAVVEQRYNENVMELNKCLAKESKCFGYSTLNQSVWR